jgi:drug/metabolite transporter (DMT)-like permease
MREVSAFGTPNVVHFCAVLLVSAILSAPWHRLSSAGLGIGLTGALGFAYAMLVLRRARRQTGYRPVLEDWLWHGVLPLIAYATLLVAAVVLRRYPPESLFVIGAAALLLLFIGIHNAWDTVTFIAVEQRRGPST